MLKVQVFSGGVLIGHADLQAADPPMGVALGKLQANEAYVAIRDQRAAPQDGGWVSLQVDLRTMDGETVVCEGGPAVADRPEVTFNEPPELTALGIAEYEGWFGSDPASVAYRERD